MAVGASIFNSHAFHLTELKEIFAVVLVIARLLAVMASECSQKILVLGQKEFLAISLSFSFCFSLSNCSVTVSKVQHLSHFPEL